MKLRLLALAAFAAAASLVLATAAGATKPLRGPFSVEPVTIPAGLACPFDVRLEPVESRQTLTIFSSGEIQVTGFFLARLVNLANGNEVTLEAGAAQRIVPEGDDLRVTTRGPIIVGFFPGDPGPGDIDTARLYYFHGRTEFVVDPVTSVFSSFDYSGKAVDLCTALA